MLDPGTSKVVEDESSGMCSPTLWSRSSPQHHHKNHYRSLSPESKTQAIERGQRELMEMVRNMPESCYELTLKDLVVEKEKPKVEEVKERNLQLSNKTVRKREGVNNGNSNSRKVDKRNGNIDSGGFYLKMVFPSSLGSKSNNKKKKESLGNNGNSNSSKVSPRTSSSVSDKEWWKKKSESNNSGSSGSHSSSRSNSRYAFNFFIIN